MAKKNLTTRSRARFSDQKRNRIRAIALQAGAWALFILIPIFLVITLKVSLYRLFFSSNPHFLLKHIGIDVVKGSFSTEYIRKQLEFVPEQTNLYAIDLQAERAKILRDTVVQDVEIRRVLPDTLHITVYGRTPVAQLMNNKGRLIDADGVILGPVSNRESKKWPVITGIGNESKFKTGETLQLPLVTKALEFLALKEVMTNKHWLDVNLIQLDEQYNELRVYLNGQRELMISHDTVLILPASDVRRGIQRAMAILEQRVKAQQPTSFIDATYEKRIPVRP